jgi:signal peptidase I
MNKPRKAWISAILTILIVGLGHIYSGNAKRGIFLYFIPQSIFVVICIGLLLKYPNMIGLILTLLLFVCFYIFCISDAIRFSKPKKSSYNLKKYNRWYIYLLCWILSAFIFQPLFGTAIKRHIIQAYKIPSGAMIPTLQIGDQILTKKKYLLGDSINRGDIVTFPFPEDPSKVFIKRVIGLGGEKFEIKEKQVFINNIPLTESYIQNTDNRIISAKQMPRDNFGPIDIPDDSLFVMGDNRDESNDSRFWGFIKKSSVTGKAISVYWSWDKLNTKVRWHRIGHSI